MHGQNAIAPYIKDIPDEQNVQYQVREIFLTLQGEGPFSGHRAVFIRLSGCNLACTFCDTEWDDDKDGYWTIEEIMHQVQSLWSLDSPPYRPNRPPLVVITGGEPLRQPIDQLVAALGNQYFHIQIETAGTLYRECLSKGFVDTVVSPKTPIINAKTAMAARAFKYVISAKDEFDAVTGVPITATQAGARKARLALPPPTLSTDSIYLSPCDEGDPEQNKENLKMAAELALKHNYVLGVQLHKLAGLD